MTQALLVYAVVAFCVSHMLAGAVEALNHGLWHWIKPRELPRFMREGRAVHMMHHKSPNKMDHILFPAWGHLALLRGITLISMLIVGPIGVALFWIYTTLTWSDAIVAYVVLCTASASGMANYMWFYGYVHRNSHTKWARTHLLYAHMHMWHHEKGCWEHPMGMPILPIYGWAMWLRKPLIHAVRMWKRIEDRRASQEAAESDEAG